MWWKKFSFRLLVFIGIMIFISAWFPGTPVGTLEKASPTASAINNPAAVYCEQLGYAYSIVKDETGERGICQLPDGKPCDAWDFLSGKCGASFSYCAIQGYGIQTRNDGADGFSQEYAVCTADNGYTIGTVSDLFGLAEKSTGCGGEVNDLPMINDSPEPDVLYLNATALAPPTSFDWRNYGGSNWMTSVKNQGGCGSCWAFSAVGTSEAVYNIDYGDPDLDLDLSEQYLNSDCHTYSGYQNCCGGWKDIALQYIRDIGIPDEGCMPYVDGSSCSCGDGTCDTNCTYRTSGSCSDRTCSDRCDDWASRLYTIDDYGYVGTNPTTIKQTLVDYGPLAVSLGIGSPFGGYFDGDIYRCQNDNGTNHAVVLVGYNDAGGYWIIKNSWGSTWNGNGYYKLGYGECSVEQYPYYVDICPSEAILKGPSRAFELGTLRRLRDELLAGSISGQAYIDLYYKHATELTRILLSNHSLRADTARLLREFLPGIQSLLGDNDGRLMVLTRIRAARLKNLLEAFSLEASPGLQAELTTLSLKVDKYTGMTLQRIWKLENR